jgi:hypothetical protein
MINQLRWSERFVTNDPNFRNAVVSSPLFMQNKTNIPAQNPLASYYFPSTKRFPNYLKRPGI